MNIQIRRSTKDDYNQIIVLYGDFAEDPKRYEKKNNDSFLKFIGSDGCFMDIATIDEKNNRFYDIYCQNSY